MEKKIVIGLNGGLGNQLYNYAFGRSLSLKFNCKLVLDKSFYKSSSNMFKESYKLNNFNINKDVEVTEDFPSYYFLIQRILKKISKKNSIRLFSLNIFLERTFLYDKQVIDKAKINSYYFGYWQSIFYFEKIRNLLLVEFSQIKIKNTDLDQFIKDNIFYNTVMIHIRGGDMSDDGLMDYVPENFYKNSINYFKKKYKKIKIHIFTDDIEYAKNKAKNILSNEDEFLFIKDLGLSDLEEFYIMKNYKNYIIARSTFSWWASYLSEIPEKKVIIPSEWFINTETPKDRIAQDMMVI